MKKAIFFHIVVLLLYSGCNSTKVVENPHAEERLNRVDTLTQSNFNLISNNLIQSLERTFKDADKAKLAFGRFINDTSITFDSDALLNKVRAKILDKGIFEIVQIDRPGGKVTDPIAASVIQRHEFIENKTTPNLPDFVLFGKISEKRIKVKNKFEYTYNFNFSLISKNGSTIWEFDEDLVKQSKRSSHSF